MSIERMNRKGKVSSIKQVEEQEKEIKIFLEDYDDRFKKLWFYRQI